MKRTLTSCYLYFVMKAKAIYQTLVLGIVIVGFTGCSSSRVVSLIVYNHFPDPVSVFDTLISNLSESGLIDSIKIIGMPVNKPELIIDINNELATKYGVSTDSILELITPELKKIKNMDMFHKLSVLSANGERIPVLALIKLSVVSQPYKPGTFLREPEQFFYDGNTAIKVILYTNRGRFKKVAAYLHILMKKYPFYQSLYNSPVAPGKGYVIIKGEIND